MRGGRRRRAAATAAASGETNGTEYHEDGRTTRRHGDLRSGCGQPESLPRTGHSGSGSDKTLTDAGNRAYPSEPSFTVAPNRFQSPGVLTVNVLRCAVAAFA